MVHIDPCQHHIAKQLLFDGAAVLTISAVQILDHHHALFHAVNGQNPALDLSQLDSETANLHLGIFSPFDFDIAVRKPTAQIAAQIEPFAVGSQFWMRQQLLVCQFTVVDIAQHFMAAGNAQFSPYPHRHRMPVIIQNEDIRIGHRFSRRRHRGVAGVFSIH